MEKNDNQPTVRDIYESIFLAIDEYMDRHNGHGPARIIITVPVYVALDTTTFVNVGPRNKRFCNIPVVVEAGQGYHIHLAEPEIQIHQFPEPVPQIVLPPDYVPREG